MRPAAVRTVGPDLRRPEAAELAAPVGERFGGRDHSTVLHAIQKIENMAKNDPDFQDTLDRLIKELEGNNHT